MARTAAELVAALNSGEPSRVLRTPEGRYTTQVLDFCKELWGVDPLAQDPGTQAAIAALPHPSYWEDEAAVRATITQWLSVLSVARSQFTRDPLAWRDKTRPPETHRGRPWINSFTFKPLPDQLPAPFTMGTETWHRSGEGGIRLVAGKDPASYAIYPASGTPAWRVATTVDLREYQEKGLQGYGIRSPFPTAPTSLLTLDRLYSHLLYCVMDCPPPGYEPAPTATWRVTPGVTPNTRFAPVVLTLECATPGVIHEWDGTSSGGGTWAQDVPDAPVTYKKYSVGRTISWKVSPPPGGWGQGGTTLSVRLDGHSFQHTYTPPTASWKVKEVPSLTRIEGGTLKPTLVCTQGGYIWGGWHYSTPTAWGRSGAAGGPDYNTLYQEGAEVSLTFRPLGTPSVSTRLTPVTANLTINGQTAQAQYQPALAVLKGTTSSSKDPSAGYLSTTLTVQSAGYIASSMSRSVPPGWTGAIRRIGYYGDWVEAGTVFEVYATRDSGTPKANAATLYLTYGGTSSSASYQPPWATWEIRGEATQDYTRFTFRCLTEGMTPWVYKSFDPALPEGTTATFELEMPLGGNNWAEKGQLGSLRYVFNKPLTRTTKTTIRLGQENGTLIGQEASATFSGEPQLSIRDPFGWLAASHAVYGEIKVDSPGVIQSQGWTQRPANGNVEVLYYPEPGKGEIPVFPLTVKAGATFAVTCTWLASQDGLGKAFAYRLGTQQWSWTS